MLNVDKYREDLLEEIKTRETANKENDNENSSGLVYFDSIGAVKRKYGGGESLYFSDDVKWLFTEYEPPLLENGDNLNPGDIIMVRNCNTDSWKQRTFMCYNPKLNGSFVTMSFLANWYSGGHECWRYARLPMDGE